jgi:hypothetical protein
MEIETYKEKLKTHEEYFSSWTQKTLDIIGEEKMRKVYNDYFVRHVVFNRDHFKCQVEGCIFHSPITLHHYKHQENGGKTTVRNCITVCRAHQDMYHRCKGPIKFNKVDVLPNHIKGMTQAHERYINGPKITKSFVTRIDLQKAKLVRKMNDEYHGIQLTMLQILILFLFLDRYKNDNN